METKVKILIETAENAIQSKVTNLKELDEVRVKFLGKKGELTTLVKVMSELSDEEKPRIG